MQILKDQETFWLQQSRVQWILEGNKNTSPFHGVATKKRTNNHIKRLINSNGQWVSHCDEIGNTLLNHFTNLFTKEDCSLSHWPSMFAHSIPPNLLSNLNQPLFSFEIDNTFFSVAPWRAPRPDGFPPMILLEVLGCYQIWCVSIYTRDVVRVY